MDSSAATRLPKELGIMVRETTPFTIHSSLSHAKGLVIDYTQYRLERMLERERDIEVISTLKLMISDYILGTIAVAWHHGTPCSVHVTKER